MATQSLLRHGRCVGEEAGLEVNLSTLNSAAAAASPGPRCWGAPATSASPSCPPLFFFLTTLTSLSPPTAPCPGPLCARCLSHSILSMCSVTLQKPLGLVTPPRPVASYLLPAPSSLLDGSGWRGPGGSPELRKRKLGPVLLGGGETDTETVQMVVIEGS